MLPEERKMHSLCSVELIAPPTGIQFNGDEEILQSGGNRV